MFEKEFRYLFRNSMVALQLVLPLILILLLSFSFTRPRPGRTGTSQLPPELVFPAAAAYMFLIVAPLAQNSFAYDGRGVQLLLAAPVRFRDVLLGKNLVFGIIVAVETAVVWLEVSFLFRPPGVLFTITTIAVLLFATLVNCVVGNWLSLQFPRRFEFGSYRRRASGVSVLVGLAFQIVLIGLSAGVYWVLHWSKEMWLLPVVFLVLSGLALPVYLATLDSYTRLAEMNRETLTSQLCR